MSIEEEAAGFGSLVELGLIVRGPLEASEALAAFVRRLIGRGEAVAVRRAARAVGRTRAAPERRLL